MNDRVRQLRSQVRSGEYKVDPAKVAEAMIHDGLALACGYATPRTERRRLTMLKMRQARLERERAADIADEVMDYAAQLGRSNAD